jgi:hypothetical protein
MKKLMTILGAFFCVSILLVSCGNEDDKKKDKVVVTKKDKVVVTKKDKVVVTPESEAKKIVDECMCRGMDLMNKVMEDPTNEDLQKEADKLSEKCDKIGKEIESKYGSKDDPKGGDAKKFWEALEVELEKGCE